MSTFIIAAREMEMFTALKVPRQLLLIFQVKLACRQGDCVEMKKLV